MRNDINLTMVFAFFMIKFSKVFGEFFYRVAYGAVTENGGFIAVVLVQERRDIPVEIAVNTVNENDQRLIKRLFFCFAH